MTRLVLAKRTAVSAVSWARDADVPRGLYS